MTNGVRVGPDCVLAAEALATSVTATIGMRGSGKSTTAGVIAEGLMDAGIQVVVIDPVGVWFGLRLGPDGKTPSRFKVPVIGGAHGDITLNPAGGRQVAEALAASKSPAILDVSMMRKSERTRFCADFAEAFVEAKKRSPSAVSLILEEAQDVVPQLMRFATPDAARCLGAFEDIASVGRNFGIGAGFRITDAGRAAAGPVVQRTGLALLDYWVPLLGEKPGAMLQVLFATGEPIERDDLATAVGLTGNAGTFGTYLSRLMSRGLVDRVGRGAYTVAKVFRQ